MQTLDLFAELPFALASEQQTAPRTPAAPVAIAAEMFPAAEVRSIAPTALDRANAVTRSKNS
jgi:hypothetical protein